MTTETRTEGSVVAVTADESIAGCLGCHRWSDFDKYVVTETGDQGKSWSQPPFPQPRETIYGRLESRCHRGLEGSSLERARQAAREARFEFKERELRTARGRRSDEPA
jgi:hypothetical protein